MDDTRFQTVSVVAIGENASIEEVKGVQGVFQGQVYARKVLRLPSERLTSRRAAAIRTIERVANTFKPLRHDHVLRIVTFYSFKNTYAIVMEPRADMDLARYLRTETSPEAREKTSCWFGCLISGLAFLHGKGIIHGDIEPCHILIKGDSVLLTVSSINSQWKDRPMTTGTLMQSVKTRYLAPEVLQGHGENTKADIFGLGAVFLEMFVVCFRYQMMEELEQFRSRSLSMVTGVDTPWIDALSETPGSLPWHSTITGLCVKMMQPNANHRPKAGDIRLWWSYQPEEALPTTACKCGVAANETDHWSSSGIKDALKTAREESYIMSKELLSEYRVKLGGKKTFMAFKDLLGKGSASRV